MTPFAPDSFTWRALRRGAAGLLLVPALLLGACGGGSDSNDRTLTSQSEGEVVIGLTDAAGDFLAYGVDVLSLSLTRADGTEVNTLPATTRIDFAQYTEMTEFLTAATIPNGRYVKATMKLKYDGDPPADIQVEDADGKAVAATTILDEDGNPATELSVDVQLENDRPLIVAPGVPAHMTLDFDLAASHSVDLSDPANPVVTVQPFLVADVDLDEPKPHRLRGRLAEVDQANEVITIQIRPVFHVGDHEFGRFKAYVSDSTVYEVDGESYTGAAGLAALALQDPTSIVVAIGELDADRKFNASEVYGGTSVAANTVDVVQGHVIARSGDELSVRGATVVRKDGSVIFHDTVAVTVCDSQSAQPTKVTKQGGGSETLDIDAISVGQRIRLGGTLSEDASAGNLSLDACGGHARLLWTQMSGEVVAVADGLLTLELQHIGGRPLSLFDFSGTGLTSAQDADPASYEVDTGTLDLSDSDDVSTIAVGSAVKVRGFVTAFGMAPPDFSARTVIDLDKAPAHLGVTWRPATNEAFVSTSSDLLMLDLTQPLGSRHHIWRRGVLTDLLDFQPTAPGITPKATSGRGLYGLLQDGTAQVFTDFASFEAELENRLSAGGLVAATHGKGTFDDSSVTFSANRLMVRLRAPAGS
ncbi:MAG TPA: DUF4382 domain-containing protein [Gammaproteobacteria bacterium]|nr:DUF4382 domain-containing protein [Gammaproteobacteria bacterium]